MILIISLSNRIHVLTILLLLLHLLLTFNGNFPGKPGFAALLTFESVR